MLVLEADGQCRACAGALGYSAAPASGIGQKATQGRITILPYGCRFMRYRALPDPGSNRGRLTTQPAGLLAHPREAL